MIKHCWVDGYTLGDIDYVNSPCLHIDVDPVCYEMARKQIRYRTFEGTHFWGEAQGLVSFFYHSGSPKAQEGFGGSRFTLPMEDGSIVKLIGPWSSRAGVMNLHFPPCLDVVFHFPGQVTGLACAVTLEFAQAAARSAFDAPPSLSKYTRLVFLKHKDRDGDEIKYIPSLVKDANTQHLGGSVVEIAEV